MTHTLKCQPPFFQAVADGVKPVEVRAEDTRRFATDDRLLLREWDSEGARYTAGPASSSRTSSTTPTRPAFCRPVSRRCPFAGDRTSLKRCAALWPWP